MKLNSGSVTAVRELAAYIESQSDEEIAQAFAELSDPVGELVLGELIHLFKVRSPIRSTPEVMGGDACVRDTRIPVWGLVQYRREGLSVAAILEAFPDLTVVDLMSAWDYYGQHQDEVEEQERRHGADAA
jgi:uncharacterized protein (DUF433 family)